MIVVELTDHTRKIELALFGDYVPQFQKMMADASGAMPICIVQYAKVKLFRDQVSIQNVINATRIMMDPDVAEVVAFRDGLAVHGIEAGGSVVALWPRIRVSMEEDFLHSYPPMVISNLNSVVDNSTFIVCATIIGVVSGEDWWYPACKCHKSVTADSGSYYCERCVKHVFQMIPRFRVKFLVTDGTGDAVFVLFDADVQHLLGQRCSSLVATAGVERGGNYPPEILALEGTKVLFKVSRVASPLLLSDCTFRVKRVCTDPAILKAYGVSAVDSVVSQAVDKPGLLGGESLSEGIPSLSEAGVDDFVSSLLVSPARSSDQQSGFSGPLSDENTPERSTGASVVRLDDDAIGDTTSISVLYPNLASGSPGCAKRSLSSAFDGDGCVKVVSPCKASKSDGVSDIEAITNAWASSVDSDSDVDVVPPTVSSGVGAVVDDGVEPPVISSELDGVNYVEVVVTAETAKMD
ncbi:replication protein A 70 kDa DNA-binding subunit C [Trifolium repens]|nr:replication protein A 70 kDa DNA-binding subunit C [Trifolium repens]